MRMLAVLCCAAVASARPCDNAPLNTTVVCDSTATPSQRARHLVSLLTFEEKLGMVSDINYPVPRLGLVYYEWCNEALHGVAVSSGVHFTPPTPYATSFPQVILSGATFNKTLWNAIGATASTEARAMHNAGHAGLSFWAPNINIIRDPRWGRGHETPGEDPYLTSIYAEHFVTGMQEGEDPYHLKVSSCCKHYYAYNMEDSDGTTRSLFNAVITLQDEADSYLPAFHSCVANGRASGIMCSYNAVNGTPTCADSRIMNGFARGKWGFTGYITSDCGAVDNVCNAHHYADADHTCRDVLEAGMDIDCGQFMGSNLNHSVVNGVTPLSALDTAMEHIWEVMVRLGIFDPADSQPYLSYTFAEKVNTPAHQQLALQAAQEGIVLLKNDGTFPLDAQKHPTVAVVGPNANATTVMQGSYAGIAPYLVSPLAGVSKYVATEYALGCDTDCLNEDQFAEAVRVVKEADAVLLVIGLSVMQEGEGQDRTTISLPGLQEELITTITQAANGKPVMLAVMAGGSVDLTIAKNNPAVKGIMWVGYPGQSGGDAIADVLFGKVNPSGRLPATQYPKDYIRNLTMINMAMRPGQNNPGRTYRFYTGEAVYPFGYGLSYTTFAYKNVGQAVTIPLAGLVADCQMNNENSVYSVTAASKVFGTLRVNVTNTKNVAGADTVLAFSKSPNAGRNGVPLKSLIGFEKVFLQPGQTATVVFSLHSLDLASPDVMGKFFATPGKWTIMIGEGSNAIEVPVTVSG